MERQPTCEIELRDTSGAQLSQAPEGNAEKQQETAFAALSRKECSTSLQEPRPQSCGEHACTPETQPRPLCNAHGAAGSASLEDSWEMVECPAPAAEPVAKPLRSARQKKVEDPFFPIRKALIPKQKAMSPRFYTSKDGYLIQIEFRYNSDRSRKNNVHVYIYTYPGKNDKCLNWPLRGKVQIYDTRHTSEIPAIWERPGAKCKGELNIPYEKLKEDRNGMLKFYVQVIPN